MSNSRYILNKMVAKGGMAEIYLGKQIGEDGFQRICCIKRVLPHYSGETEYVNMFRDEAHIGKSLQHANIVKIEGFEEVEGSYAMIMEFVNGGDLRTILGASEKQNQRMATPHAIFAIAEAARGLHYAHTRVDLISGKPLEIVHRDISPQNILISFEGEVKITDFGIADADSKENETKPGTVKGKYSYMSPEQIMAKTVDARSDVFALTVVLWECLAMKRLFLSENEVATIQKVRACEVREQVEGLENIDEDLRAIISKGLEKDPKNRFQTAQEFENALRHYLSRAFPDFTAADLGGFLKEILAVKREENLSFIKELLSQKSTPPANAVGSAPPPQVPVPQGKSFVAARAREAGQDEGDRSSRGDSLPQSLKSKESRGSQARSAKLSQEAFLAKAASARRKKDTRSSGESLLVGLRSRSKKRTQQEPNILGALLRTILIILVVGAISYLSYQKYAPKDPLDLQIRTSPSRVKLSLDGRYLFSGRYIETPVLISGFGPGKHKVTAHRKGFRSEAIEFFAKDYGRISPSEIFLSQVAKMAPTRLRLIARPQANVKVDLDNGAYVSIITTQKDENIENVVFGELLLLSVMPNYPSSKGRFSCRFTPRSTSWKAPFIVEINAQTRQCHFPLR